MKLDESGVGAIGQRFTAQPGLQIRHRPFGHRHTRLHRRAAQVGYDQQHKESSARLQQVLDDLQVRFN